MATLPLPSLSSEIRILLPILYLAWADEVLTPSEISAIEALLARQTWISQEDRSWISSHLDPKNPPTAMELKGWLYLIRKEARHLSTVERRDLLTLGQRIARLGKTDEEALSPEAAKAVRELEKIMEPAIHAGEALREAIEPTFVSPMEPPLAPVPFSPSAMRRIMEGEYLPLKNRVFTVLSDPAFSYDRIPEDKSGYRDLVMQWLQAVALQGWGSLSYPVAQGGRDDMRSYVAVFEAMGHHDLSLLIKFGVQVGLFGGAILNLGTKAHHEAYLAGAGNVSMPGCFAMTEAGHGSNVRDIETTATYEEDSQEFVIHTPHHQAHKEYIGNAALHARYAVVFAQLRTMGESFGVHAFVVEIRDESGRAMPGVTIGDSGGKLGLNGVDNGRLWFHQVRIPRENLLNKFGQVSEDGQYQSPIASESARFFTMLGTLVGGRICVPMAGLSAAKSGLSIAIRYANRRRQFGKAGEPESTIMSYPSHQMRLMPLLASTFVFDVVQKRMADRYVAEKDTGHISRELESMAAGIKALSTWHSTATLQECREACGGNGYLAVNRLGQLKADTEIFSTFEGDNTVLLQLVAKGRLTEFRQSFGAMNVGGMLLWAGSEAMRSVTEKNPITIRNTDPDHLSDTDFHLAALRYREDRLVWTAGQRVKHRISAGLEPYDAVMEVQTHLLELARAYMERMILEDYHAWLGTLDENDEKQILRKLGDLFALGLLHKHAAWFLEQDYFANAKSKAIRSLREQLCASLAPYAESLVEVWAIPDPLLYAPIALDK
ncbi:MAG: acyl-CoA dehydrogenase family protein [Bacteroidia bacterium]|nr:acyl-CoA dehydrogenase family protein [Bacteroidia bacterium]